MSSSTTAVLPSTSRAPGPAGLNGEQSQPVVDSHLRQYANASPESIRASAQAEEDALTAGAATKQAVKSSHPQSDATLISNNKTPQPPTQKLISASGASSDDRSSLSSSSELPAAATSATAKAKESDVPYAMTASASIPISPLVLAAALRGDEFPPEGTRGLEWIAAQREARRVQQQQQAGNVK